MEPFAISYGLSTCDKETVYDRAFIKKVYEKIIPPFVKHETANRIFYIFISDLTLYCQVSYAEQFYYNDALNPTYNYRPYYFTQQSPNFPPYTVDPPIMGEYLIHVRIPAIFNITSILYKRSGCVDWFYYCDHSPILFTTCAKLCALTHDLSNPMNYFSITLSENKGPTWDMTQSFAWSGRCCIRCRSDDKILIGDDYNICWKCITERQISEKIILRKYRYIYYRKTILCVPNKLCSLLVTIVLYPINTDISDEIKYVAEVQNKISEYKIVFIPYVIV